MADPEVPRGRALVSRGVFLRASAWAIGSRWLVRLLGLASTIVLARLLTPEDFGVVATAMIVVGFSEAIFEFGVRTVLIHAEDLTRADYDTAWTMSLIQACAGGLLTAALAVPASVYFGDPQVVPVMIAMGAAMAFGGLKNIGIVDFQRDLTMGADFVLFVAEKAASVAVAIAAAVILQSYWAMVAGYAALMVTSVVMSYVMHSYRPRLSLARLRKFMRMSVWLTMQAVGRFAQTRLDRMVVGGVAGTAALGFYSVASDLAFMLIGELLAPVGRALLPAFAAMQTQADRLRAAMEQAVAGTAALALPAAAGAALTAPQIVSVVFGEQWMPSVPIFQVLCLTMGVHCLRNPAGTLLVAVGRMALSGWGTWAQAAVFVGSWWLWFRDDGLTGVAVAMLIAATAFTTVSYGRVLHLGLLRGGQLMRALARPALATLGMTVVLLNVPPLALPGAVTLAVHVSLGAATYGSLLLLAWVLMGRPSGIERLAIDMLQSGLRRRRTAG